MRDEAELEAKLGKIRAHFLANLQVSKATLESFSIEFHQGNTSAAHLEEVRSIVHKISGVAATLGFIVLGQRAAEVEANLDVLAESEILHKNAVHISENLSNLLSEIETISD